MTAQGKQPEHTAFAEDPRRQGGLYGWQPRRRADIEGEIADAMSECGKDFTAPSFRALAGAIPLSVSPQARKSASVT